MNTQIQVIDDIIPICMQDYVYKMCLSKEFRWTFIEDSAFSIDDPNFDKLKKNPSFSHVLLSSQLKNKKTSSFSDSFNPIIFFISHECNLNFEDIIRARVGLYLPVLTKSKHNNIHVDHGLIKHNVILYYINDSDGDTFFFDNNENITDRVSPKKGRVVIFDGHIKHASSMPSKNHRLTLNINYIKNIKKNKIKYS